MRQPISLQTAKENHSNNQESQHLTHLGLENQSLSSSTLSLILQTLRYDDCKKDLSNLHLKQCFKKWTHSVEFEVANTQVAKALKITMDAWIELQIGHEENAIQRNAKAEKLFKHIITSIGVLNLSENKKAITVLHYIMLHPINELTLPVMNRQADLFKQIASDYFRHENKPSYTKIAQKLFLYEKKPKNYRKKYAYIGIGMTIGIFFAKILSYSLGVCVA